MQIIKHFILISFLSSIIGSTFGQELRLIVPQNKLIDSTQYLAYDLKSLRILRNSIFAQYGYIFKSEDLTSYFTQFNWYIPRTKNVNDTLSDLDKENIRIIQNIERLKKNPENYKDIYYKNIPELAKNLTMSDLRCNTLLDYEYIFWDVKVPENEYYTHTCYDICGKITTKTGFILLYHTWECPAASAGNTNYNLNLYDTDFNIKQKITLFSEDGIFDIGSLKLRNDTLTTTLEKYKGGYYDDYEDDYNRDTIPYEINVRKYIIDIKNTEIKRIQ